MQECHFLVLLKVLIAINFAALLECILQEAVSPSSESAGRVLHHLALSNFSATLLASL